TGRELLALKGHTDGVHSVCFSPDGTRLATASMDKTARLGGAPSREGVVAPQGDTARGRNGAFKPGGRAAAPAPAGQAAARGGGGADGGGAAGPQGTHGRGRVRLLQPGRAAAGHRLV